MAIKTALVVDDSKSARLMLKKLLSKKSLEIESVENGEEAIEYLDGRETYPDVIFMDHMMPGMNGLETTKKITEKPETDSIPIVMFTSKEDSDYLETARSHGASAVLKKPATPSELDDIIEYISSLNEPEEEQDMQTAVQIQEIDYDEIRRVAQDAVKTTAIEAVASSLPDILQQLPKPEDTSAIRNSIQALEQKLESLQGQLSAIVDAIDAQSTDASLSDELVQQVETTAETAAIQVAESVAARVASEQRSAQSEGFVQLTVNEHRRLKTMSKVGMLAAFVALAVALF